MGIELRLNITPEGIRSLCFGEGREALLAAFKHHNRQNYSPNRLVNPVVLANNAVGSFLDEHVEPQIGTDKFAEVRGFLKDSVNMRMTLLDAVVKGNSSESEIERLVDSHFSELQAVPGYFALLSRIDVSKADSSRRGLFELGLLGFALMLIEANEMYGHNTQTQFLQYVSQGMLNEDFEKGMHVSLKSTGRRISGEDVLRLFTEQREPLRDALLYKLEGSEARCSPDLLVQHAFAAQVLGTTSIASYLSERGVREHELLAAYDVASSWQRLISYLDSGHSSSGGNSGRSTVMSERQLKMLASLHARRLSGLTGFYQKLSEVDISGMTEEDAEKFRQGVESLLRTVVRAKAMYHPETSTEFLQHVKASALERPYDLGMLAAAKSIVPKTL